MTTQQQNAAIAQAIKEIGNNAYEFVASMTLIEAATAINLQSFNSGFYTPKAIQVKGLDSILFLNQDGSLIYEYMVLQNGEKFDLYRLKYTEYSNFENKYRAYA